MSAYLDQRAYERHCPVVTPDCTAAAAAQIREDLDTFADELAANCMPWRNDITNPRAAALTHETSDPLLLRAAMEAAVDRDESRCTLAVRLLVERYMRRNDHRIIDIASDIAADSQWGGL